jgi:hypothetical protein
LDTDGDGVPDSTDNCPAASNPGQEDADGDDIGDHCDTGDFDGDGYTDEVEARYIGTAPDKQCGAGWPSNLVEPGPGEPFLANGVDILDVTSFLGPVRRFDTDLSDFIDNKRWDLIPGSDVFEFDLNIQDLTTLFHGNSGSPAFPPMFGFEWAWERTCPSGP